MMKKRNYNVHLAVGTTAQHMWTVTAVMDTGTGPDLVSRKFLPTTGRDRISPTQNIRIRSETKKAVQVGGAVLLHVILRELRVTTCFEVVRHFIASSMLGTT